MRNLLFFTLLFSVRFSVADPFVILLDPGHTPQFPGAIGCRGREEIHYNDEFVALLEKKLANLPNTKVLVTRKPGVEIELAERAELGNRSHVGLILAVHHDSANPKYLVESEKDGRKSYCLSEEFKKKFHTGFSLFVSKKNPLFERSLKFAEALGKEMVSANRPISDYHTEKLENENRVFINKRLGVYQYDDLIVLKKATVPAVLLEVGVISDPKDELFIVDEKNRESLSNAVVRALQPFTRGK